jgi:hypothetical protein
MGPVWKLFVVSEAERKIIFVIFIRFAIYTIFENSDGKINGNVYNNELKLFKNSKNK